MKDLKELIAVMERVRAVQAGIFIFSIASNGAVCDPYKTMPVEVGLLLGTAGSSTCNYGIGHNTWSIYTYRAYC